MTGAIEDVCADAIAHISSARLIELTQLLVDRPSPTGEEALLAHDIADVLRKSASNVEVQHLDETAANSWATLIGPRDQTLLLYAPLDTVTSGNHEEDWWSSTEARGDMKPMSTVDGDLITGLGAHNPKGHAACVIMAFEALAKSGGIEGTVVAGFGCLGMPADRRRPELLDGHGAGCAALVDTVAPDACIIAKSGWQVSHTEVGLMWFTLRVIGHHNYVGSRHLMPYRNPIVDAGRLIAVLEPWLEKWAEAHSDGFNQPQGIVGFIEGGKPQHRAFTPAVCTFGVDLRIPPGLTPEEAEAQFQDAVDRMAAELGITVTIDRTVTIEGTKTDMGEPIIAAAIRSWEAIEGCAHESQVGLSGATDANILRKKGVPTARIGLPKAAAGEVDIDFARGMNTVSIASQLVLTQHLIRSSYAYFEAVP